MEVTNKQKDKQNHFKTVRECEGFLVKHYPVIDNL